MDTWRKDRVDTEKEWAQKASALVRALTPKLRALNATP
jgi:hypothetical protein